MQKEEITKVLDNFIDKSNKLKKEIAALDESDPDFDDIATVKLLRWAKEFEDYERQATIT